MDADGRALLDALRDDPDDLTLPLVFADWLEDHGDAEQAAFIRLQCARAGLAPDDESEVARSLRQRDRDASSERSERLYSRLGFPEGMVWGLDYSFARGFLVGQSLPGQWLVDAAETLASEAPLLRKLTVGRVNGWGERLAALPLLRQITDFEVEAWIAPADAQAIAFSPHLGRLRSLETWLGNQEGGDDETLAAFAGGVARAYPQLDELRIIDHPGCRPETIEEANRLAGRAIARVVIPMPRLYPIAADFSGSNFAGHLPDGTQLFAEAPTNLETAARLFCFNPEGEQTEIREIPVPYEVRRVPGELYGKDLARLQQFLNRTVGYTPGLIRIRHIDDPRGICRIDPDGDEFVGMPDDPHVRPEDDNRTCDIRGHAAVNAYWFKYGAYAWGDSNWFIGPDGTIEST